MGGTGTDRRGDIQGLRAVAVLLVVLGHAGVSGLTGGYVGVDVFFVISGFLITGLLVREVRRSGRVSIANFYARRARRILPAASVVLVVVVLASGQIFNYLRADEVQTHAIWAAFFAANVYSAAHGTGYFDETGFVSPVQHFWSLAVEEQFYLVWPALIALLLSRRRARRAKVPRRLPIAVAVLCVGSLAWSIWSTSAEPAAAYYSAPARAWELGIGALLALGTDRLARAPRALRATMSWAGIGAIAVAALTFSPATPFPGYHALLPTAGAALVLAGGTGGPSYGASLLLDRLPMRWIGDLSYSLYLWHWPFLVLPAVYLDRELRSVERVVVVIAALAVSTLSYRFVETPVRQARSLTRHRLRALLMWPATAAVVIGVVAGGQLGYGPSATAHGARVPADDGPARTLSPTEAAAHAAELARAAAPLPRELRPSLLDLRGDVAVPPHGCFADREQTEHNVCILGDPAARRTLVLFGDSHVSMWMDPIVRAAQQRGWRVAVLMKASCFPADVTPWRVDKQRPYTECVRYRQWALGEIARLKPAQIVVSGAISVPLADPATGQQIASTEDSNRVFAAGADRAMRTLRTLAPQVYAISGTTNLRMETRDCLAARKATRATCSERLDPRVAERNVALRKAAGAQYIDAVPWLCDAQTCPVVIGNVIAYRDTNHISRTFVETIGDELVRRLRL